MSWDRRGGWVWGLLATLATPALAQPRELRLDEAVQIALEHQPSMLQARASTGIAQARAEQGRAPLLPQVTGSVSFAHSRIPSNLYNTNNLLQVAVTGTQTLW